MKRRRFLRNVGVIGIAGSTAAVGSVAASDDGYDVELVPGTTFEYASTSLNEQFIYADLPDGSTFYLFEHRYECCQVDTVVMVLSETGEVLYLESLDGVLYTEDEIGEMADRIGEMADRIV
ncbi:MAG: hypothetical protein V5A33_04100, partial [Halobacteriales archaeon]